MSDLFEGECQCGHVRYRIEGTAVLLFACHCTECQRQSASAFGMALWIRDYQKRVLRGELASWTRVMPAGAQLIGDFCVNCGSRLFHQVAGQSEVLSIKPGTLDGLGGLKPIAHIWTSSAQRWLQLPSDALLFPRNPPNFDTLLESWRGRAAVAGACL